MTVDLVSIILSAAIGVVGTIITTYFVKISIGKPRPVFSKPIVEHAISTKDNIEYYSLKIDTKLENRGKKNTMFYYRTIMYLYDEDSNELDKNIQPLECKKVLHLTHNYMENINHTYHFKKSSEKYDFGTLYFKGSYSYRRMLFKNREKNYILLQKFRITNKANGLRIEYDVAYERRNEIRLNANKLPI